MPLSSCPARARRAAASLLATLLLATPIVQGATRPTPAPRRAKPPVASEPPSHLAPLTQEEQATQILNRFTFGPRPGEIAEVTRIGWPAWFEQQLNPASISDAALDKRLAQYPALQLTPQQLALQFPDGQVVRRVAEGKLPPPSDPQLAGVYEVLVARYQRKQAEDKADATSTAPPSAAAPTLTPDQIETQKQARKQQQKQEDQAQARVLADQILAYPKNQRMQVILRLPVQQRMVLTGGIAEPEKTLLQNDATPRERELFQMMGSGYGGNGVLANELAQAKVLRAVLSERQLQEVMTDFWFNHFNIDLSKAGDEIAYAPSYERDAIRAHALGKFRDLLLATAEHPAMLIYLDNWLSIGPGSQAAGRPRPGAKGGPRGLNENYGREVMELHTVGVNGGYSQADVTTLAKILTGWTIDQPQLGGGPLFDQRRHEPGNKLWFGQKIPEGGMDEGVRALTWLAAQPQTAHFISYKLAQRFVSDAPPAALVDRMAATYMSSDGDIRAVLHAMVQAPEFFSRANYRNKVKMPLEYVASSLRATATDPTNPASLVAELRVMGEPLYRCLPPTGYASTADRWMNSAALVDRLNYALQLTGGKFGGMRFDAPRLLASGLLNRVAPPPALTQNVALHTAAVQASGQQEALTLMEGLLIPGTVSDRTNAIIRQQLSSDAVQGQDPGPANSANLAGPASPAQQNKLPDAAPDVPAALAASLPDPAEKLDKLAAMILGSPEFQVH